MAVTCPKCGFEQDDGTECIRCGIIFAKYKPPPPPPLKLQAENLQADGVEATAQTETRPEQPVAESDPKPNREAPSLFKRVFRIAPWVALVGAIGVFVLIFQQAPPIHIETDPLAAERVARKMAELQMAMEAGRAHTLALNEAELNAWMQQNLALANSQAGGNLPPGEANVQDVQSAMKDVRINLFGNQVRAYAVFNVHGRNLSLQLEGRIRAQDGQLRLEPTKGMLGSLPIPQVTLDNVVHRLFDSPDNRETFQLAPTVSNVTVENGELLVSYR